MLEIVGIHATTVIRETSTLGTAVIIEIAETTRERRTLRVKIG
jgi:hypothetical protein